MNSSVLPSVSLDLHSTPERHEPAPPKRALLQRALISGGVSVALSAAFYWGVLMKAVPTDGSFIVTAPPDQAIYVWKGFCRVAPPSHLKEPNSL